MSGREKNPTMEEQLQREEAQRVEQDDTALQELLDELETSPRKLSSAELAFLQRQSDRLENELAKSHEESTEYDNMGIKTDKIRKILESQES